MADQADHLARFDCQADVARDAACAVAETDVGQFDAPGDRLAVIDAWLLGKSRRDRDLILLELELALAAVRQAPLRRLLAERYAATRAQVAALLADGLADADAAALPVDSLAAVIVAVTDGLPLQGLVDPDAVPETAFSDAVARMLGLADDDDPEGNP